MITGAAIPGLLQRKCACAQHTIAGGECAECRKKRLQRKASNYAKPGTVPTIVHEVLRSPGQPLDAKTRAFMEPRFGHDFSGVRAHTDYRAAESAHAVNALAYTVGQDVVFGAGQYAPSTAAGQKLLSHELAHIVQQQNISTTLNISALRIGIPDDPYEQEADAVANSVVLSEPVPQARLRQNQPWLRRQLDFGSDVFPTPKPFNREGGSTLPYREATELAECIRIMGEENASYCRQEVLGETPQPECTLGIQANPVVNPMANISTFQSPGASGWWGAKFGCYRNGCTRRHRGWDLHAATGTSIRAVVTGTMTRHNNPGGYGQYVRLASEANPQREYIYAHLSQREPAGDYCVGDKLGETGVTGNASANRPHLHFEVRESGTAVDPATYLTEPNRVVETTGSGITAINKTLPPPCAPC